MESRIATNTNLIAFSRDSHLTMTEAVPMLASGGFKVLDLNFCEMMGPSSPLNDERADSYISELDELRKSSGLEYFQCHLPYPRNSEESNESNALIFKAIGYAERLGIKTAVIHPIKGSAAKNIAYLDKFIRNSSSISFAVENMEREDEIHSADSLLAIAANLDRTGICLDTGHANVMGEDIPEFIYKAGSYLIATHLSDNDGKNDLHMLPGMGNIKWEEVIPAFRESYSGYLNYEAMFYGRNLPSSFRKKTIEMSISISSWLLSL